MRTVRRRRYLCVYGRHFIWMTCTVDAVIIGRVQNDHMTCTRVMYTFVL